MMIEGEIEAAAKAAYAMAVAQYPHIADEVGESYFIMGFALGASWAADFSKEVRLYLNKDDKEPIQ